MANFWCVDSKTSESNVIKEIPISGVLQYGQSHCDIYTFMLLFDLMFKVRYRF